MTELIAFENAVQWRGKAGPEVSVIVIKTIHCCFPRFTLSSIHTHSKVKKMHFAIEIDTPSLYGFGFAQGFSTDGIWIGTELDVLEFQVYW